jgi:hypothetical protein
MIVLVPILALVLVVAMLVIMVAMLMVMIAVFVIMVVVFLGRWGRRLTAAASHQSEADRHTQHE